MSRIRQLWRRRRPARDKQSERERRMAYFDAAQAETPLLAVESKHGSFLVSTADRRIARTVFTKGHYAAGHLTQTLKLLADLGFADVQSGALLDIGANIGTVAIPALTHHGMARAIAFEPHPDNVRLLRMNAVYNGLEERLDVVPCALSDRDGHGTLEVVNPRHSGSHEVAEPGGGARPGVETVEIELRTLDGLETEGRIRTDDIALVWLDVQGHEPHVLGGASRLLSRGVPVVTEFHPALLRRKGTYDEMAAAIAEHFEAFVDLRHRADGAPFEALPVDRLTTVTDSLGDRFSDLLLVPRRGGSGRPASRSASAAAR